VPLKATLRLLVWASIRVLGEGRVEPRSNGGCWAQGVCRAQSSNRGERERSGADLAEVSALGVSERQGGLKKERKKEKSGIENE
jgi:hypothetical protein